MVHGEVPMRSQIGFRAVAFVGFGWLLLAGDRSPCAEVGDAWKQVDEAMEQGLPRTAIERLEPIIARAVAEKDFPQAIKALARKVGLEAGIEGNKPEEKIVRLQAAIGSSPPEMHPVMRTILAHWYWQYYQQNRWRFLQRTRTTEAPGPDIATWDLARIYAEIDVQLAQALSAADELRKIPIERYDALLTRGDLPDAYRPTLWDFIAHEAIAFWGSGEQAGARPQDSFEIQADGPIFDAPERFLEWKPETSDAESPRLRAILLFQEVLRFHQGDADRTAFIDADLARLRFGWNLAVGETKTERYRAALRRFVEAWGSHEISARALAELAETLQAEENLVEAHRVATEGDTRFPSSPGGRLCHNLIAQIEARSSSVATERVWSRPFPKIEVRYRNVVRIWFRAVRYDWAERLKTRRGNPGWLDPNDRQELLAKRPSLAWSADLPPTSDYRERVEALDPPEDLAPGAYFLLASHDHRFGEVDNQVSFTDVWVSELALVIRSHQGEGFVDGLVLSAGSGEPIEGAEVFPWTAARSSWSRGRAIRTDSNGMFRYSTPRDYAAWLQVVHAGDELATAHGHQAYRQDLRQPLFERTVFFTDRSLYRPGQTIQYKGISISANQEAGKYSTIAGRRLTVVFLDVNEKEVARQSHRTNDWGSFSGSFTAPRDRLLGRMTIRVEGDPAGEAAVSVEEYKRPKFLVAIDPPAEAARLGAEVTVKGTATAYTGAAIDGAQVSYRVVREVRYPPWWGWYYWWREPRTDSQEIATGTTTTRPDGSFEVRFVARPDASVDPKGEPIFRFAVHADVTDTAGETRSADRTVCAAYTALAASLRAADWQVASKQVSISVRTESLDGEGQKADGTLRIHRLRQPEKAARPPLERNRWYWAAAAAGGAPAADPSNPASWPLGEAVAERGFTTDAEGSATVSVDLAAGAYRAVLETQDRFGKAVTATLPLTVLDPEAKRLGIKVPNLVEAESWTVEPGSELVALWGSGYDAARAYIEIEHRRKVVRRFWTEPGTTQAAIRHKVDEGMRGGFTLRVTMVRENRAYLHSTRIDVPWTNKDLSIRWERFVSKLEPAQKETWTAVIAGPGARKAAAEMVAGLYDASLDAYLPHGWPWSFNVFRQEWDLVSAGFENRLQDLQHLAGQWATDRREVRIEYRALPPSIVGHWGVAGYGGVMRMAMRDGGPISSPAAAPAGEALAEGAMADMEMAPESAALVQKGAPTFMAPEGEPGAPPAGPAPDLSKVSARTNLNETAFFFPHLVSSEEGEVRMEFTMPEALTEWKLLGFAHDRELRSGFIQDKAVTAKDLMVQPNPPRFLRSGDLLQFTVKVSNQSAARQEGMVRLTVADARTGKVLDRELGIEPTDLPFDLPSKESRTSSWTLRVGDDLGFLTYKAVASSGGLSDGEEGFLPVLSRRVLVRESLALPLRGAGTREFRFAKLVDSQGSDTIRNVSLTVQMVSNPSWYAVLALPYLMEFPHECSEQAFNRLYANALARHIAGSDPKIRRVFDQWKGTDALDSPLEKNEDLKSVALQETPWVRDAQAESQARRNVAILFDENRLEGETTRTLAKLSELQREDGSWPWFPGGPSNEYITLYIATGFGRMRHLGVEMDVGPALRALESLDDWMDQTYRDIRPDRKAEDNLSPTVALYLYGRSFFLKDREVAAEHREALAYFLDQARKHWLKLYLQSQAHLALAFKRFGDAEAAAGIVRSIQERAVTSEELGMSWRELEASWWWYQAPIETQAALIEALDEVAGDAAAVEAAKVWLLKQKQTRDWKTTKATADAVYALLIRGADLLASDALVEVSLGGRAIRPEVVEAGTGFFEERIVGSEVRPELGAIVAKKTDAGVSWGGVHWQYLEDMEKVTPHEGTPLVLRKTVHRKVATERGPVLEPVRGPLAVGDELVVRIELRSDRDMEYLHLKDQRASGTEPVNVLSSYRYQDGLAYYESTRDTASHFFIDWLPRGTYVFEYSTRVVHRGSYQTGFAEIQCMYAPEFSSHSESFRLEAR